MTSWSSSIKIRFLQSIIKKMSWCDRMQKNVPLVKRNLKSILERRRIDQRDGGEGEERGLRKGAEGIERKRQNGTELTI